MATVASDLQIATSFTSFGTNSTGVDFEHHHDDGRKSTEIQDTPATGSGLPLRRRKFKARHIQMMGLGFALDPLADLRGGDRNRASLSVRKDLILRWSHTSIPRLPFHGHGSILSIGRFVIIGPS
jgi:hypothetical protein